MEKYLVDSAATEAFGRLLGRHLADGDVLCLSGDLGAGKTLLSRGIATSLGVEPEAVTSPTFAIMNVYEGKELEDIGFGEYAGGEGVTLIEWAELFSEQLPEEYLQVVLRHESAGRRATLAARGPRYERLLKEVEEDADFSH